MGPVVCGRGWGGCVRKCRKDHLSFLYGKIKRLAVQTGKHEVHGRCAVENVQSFVSMKQPLCFSPIKNQCNFATIGSKNIYFYMHM